MSKIKEIVNYFFYHEFSNAMVKRVHHRLSDPIGKEEASEAMHTVWNEMDVPPLSDAEVLKEWKRINERIDQTPGQSVLRAPKVFLHGWRRTAALWVIPLLLFSVSLYMLHETKEMKKTIAAVSFIEKYVPNGKREKLVLPDKSEVWLNSGTMLVYPSLFIGSQREVYLSGEGSFTVEGNPQKPFLVRTANLVLKVLGTKFNLSAYPDATNVVATLKEGSVNIQITGNVKTAQKIYLLKPDEQLTYNHLTGEVAKTSVSPAHFSDWKTGGLAFDNSSFNEVLHALEKRYNVSVQLQTSIYNTNRLTISFNRNEQLETVMMLIKEMIPGLDYRIDGTTILIK